MKYLLLLSLFTLPACASSNEKAREYYAESIEDCYLYGSGCEFVQNHPICHGGSVDAETCGVLIYEAERSDEEMGYGEDRARLRLPH